MRKIACLLMLSLHGNAMAGECAAFDASGSEVRFTVEQAGMPFTGYFRDVTGEVCRDGDALMRVRASIDAASVDTGLPELDALLKGTLFLDVARHPQIHFESRDVVQRDGKWLARGALQINGQERDVELPFMRVDDRRAQGALEVRRLDYGVGTGEWENTDWLANEVKVAFDVVVGDWQ